MKNILILITAIIAFMACKTGDKQEVKTLPITKKEYTLLHKGNGEKLKVDDILKFSLLIVGNNGDTLVDKRDSADWVVEKVMEVDSNVMPIVEMLYSLTLGDSAKMNIPLDAGMKPQGMEEMDTIVYFIKVQQVMSQEEYDKELEAKQQEQTKKIEALAPVKEEVANQLNDILGKYKAGQLSELIKTDDGTDVYVIEKGNGSPVTDGESISIDYYGAFKEKGDMFDNSYDRGQELKFSAGKGQMIKGMDAGVLKLNHGDKAMIFIPYQSAYGEAGRPPMIPEKADLVFYVDVK